MIFRDFSEVFFHRRVRGCYTGGFEEKCPRTRDFTGLKQFDEKAFLIRFYLLYMYNYV